MLGISVRLLISALCCALIVSTGVASAAESRMGVTYYTVRDGDTLYGIGEHYQVAPNVLAITNGINGHLIFPGQILTIPTGVSSDVGAVEPAFLIGKSLSPEDLLLLAQAIHAEARGEPFTGKVAVGAVVLNRLASPFFPKTLSEVIFQRTNQVYQFSPVGDGSIHLPPDEESLAAAVSALNGQDPSHGALFFYNPDTAKDCWIRSLPVVVRIGNHVFCR